MSLVSLLGLRVRNFWSHVGVIHGGIDRHALQIEVGSNGRVVGRTVGFVERSGSCCISFFGSTGIDCIGYRDGTPLTQRGGIHVLSGILCLALSDLGL